MKLGLTKSIFLLALMGLVGALGFDLIKNEGYSSRLSDTALKDLSQFNWNKGDDWDYECAKLFPGSSFCKMQTEKGLPTVALIGDSHANQFFYGLSNVYKKEGDILVQVGVAACPPILGIEADRRIFQRHDFGGWCKEYVDIFRRVIDDKNIRTVILAANWHLYFLGRRYDSPDLNAKTINYVEVSKPESYLSDDRLNELLVKTIEYLLQNGKKVILIKQIPELNFDPRNCYLREFRRVGNANKDCKLDYQKVKTYLDEYLVKFDKSIEKLPKLIVWDPFPIFCPASECKLSSNGLTLWRDASHLSKAGSTYFSELVNR